MSDVRVPREAIEAAQKSLCDLPEDWTRNDWLADSWFCAQEMLEAALPFLRAQWEADLLSDKAIERAAIELEEGFTGLPAGTVIAAGDEQWHTAARWHAEAIIRAALSSCVRSEGEDA